MRLRSALCGTKYKSLELIIDWYILIYDVSNLLWLLVKYLATVCLAGPVLLFAWLTISLRAVWSHRQALLSTTKIGFFPAFILLIITILYLELDDEIW